MSNVKTRPLFLLAFPFRQWSRQYTAQEAEKVTRPTYPWLYPEEREKGTTVEKKHGQRKEEGFPFPTENPHEHKKTYQAKDYTAGTDMHSVTCAE